MRVEKLDVVGGMVPSCCHVAGTHINSAKASRILFIPLEAAAGTQTLLSFSAPTSNGKWEFHKITHAHLLVHPGLIRINNDVTAPAVVTDATTDDIYFKLNRLLLITLNFAMWYKSDYRRWRIP